MDNFFIFTSSTGTNEAEGNRQEIYKESNNYWENFLHIVGFGLVMEFADNKK